MVCCIKRKRVGPSLEPDGARTPGLLIGWLIKYKNWFVWNPRVCCCLQYIYRQKDPTYPPYCSQSTSIFSKSWESRQSAKSIVFALRWQSVGLKHVLRFRTAFGLIFVTTSLIFFRLNAKCDTTCHCYATQLCQRNVGMAGAVIRELFVLGKEVSHLNEEAAWQKHRSWGAGSENPEASTQNPEVLYQSRG